MEVLNNVQLEGRRINVEISKMMVAEDVITTEEVLVVVVLVEVLLQEEKVLQEKVQAVVEATETQVQRRWIWWKKLCSKRRRFWRKKFSSRGEGSSDRAQDVLKVLVTHLDQDQEETNIYC
jgi:DNA polymerase III psi subunit